MDRSPLPDVDLDMESLPLATDDGGQEPPRARDEGGRGRPEDDHLLARSPWWVLPLTVSLLIGAERVLMLSFLPGWREFGVAVFGAAFVATFALVLAAGGLYIAHYRR